MSFTSLPLGDLYPLSHHAEPLQHFLALLQRRSFYLHLEGLGTLDESSNADVRMLY